MKKLFAACALVLASVSVASICSAETWCHTSFKSIDGTELKVDYVVDHGFSRFSGEYNYMTKIWVHAANAAFSGSEQVRFLTMSFDKQSGNYYSGNGVDASWDAGTGRFTASSPFASVISTNWGSAYVFELAVVVNDQWLKDPVSGGSNFRFYPQDFPNACANPY